MITFHSVSWAEYFTDSQCQVLWQEHYAEFTPGHLNRMLMSPDIAAYEALDRTGQLEIIVAREKGIMVGYCLVAVRPHLHYSQTLCAFEDSYFLTARCRKGLAGYRLVKYTLEVLRKRGVQRAFWMTKEFISVAKIFERLGGAKTDTVYGFWLGEF